MLACITLRVLCRAVKRTKTSLGADAADARASMGNSGGGSVERTTAASGLHSLCKICHAAYARTQIIATNTLVRSTGGNAASSSNIAILGT